MTSGNKTRETPTSSRYKLAAMDDAEESPIERSESSGEHGADGHSTPEMTSTTYPQSVGDEKRDTRKEGRDACVERQRERPVIGPTLHVHFLLAPDFEGNSCISWWS